MKKIVKDPVTQQKVGINVTNDASVLTKGHWGIKFERNQYHKWWY